MLLNFRPENNIQRLPKELVPVRVLEYFDEELLTEYKAHGGGVYIEKWCEQSENLTRYLIVKSDMRTVAEYLAERVSMMHLLTNSSDYFGFIVDKDFDLNIVGVYPIVFSQLPEEYLPTAETYHLKELRPVWKTIPLNYLIDENWNAKLLSNLEKRLTTVAGFAFFTKTGAVRKLPGDVMSFVFDSGYSYYRLYDRIRSSVPPEYQTRSVGVAAASPGILTIDSPSIVVDQIYKSISALPLSAPLLKVVYAWSKGKMETHESIPDTAFIELASLCESVYIDINSIFPEPTDFNQNPQSNKRTILTAAKLVVAYIRNLKKLAAPDEGIELLNMDNFNLSVEYDEEDQVIEDFVAPEGDLSADDLRDEEIDDEEEGF